MKIRNGFVTNSSSSSFVSVRIDNPKFAALIEKYDNLFEDDMCVSVYTDDSEVNIQIEEGYAEVPDNIENLLDCIISIFDESYYFYDDEECEENNEEKNSGEAGSLEAFIYELKSMKNNFVDDTNEVEFTVSDIGWQGDSESRYEKSNYDEDTLDDIYEEIASNKGISKDSVTDEDFFEYVSDKVSTEENTYFYNKKENREEHTRSFYVE